ncbi:MAG: hypothetical protein PHG81_03135 [Aliarcobacter sp.]|nr:hypothetical protein [Aliarcobacter sp.]
MFLLRFLILFFLALNIFANDDYINSLTLSKVKKLIEKEEEIATEYKKYILEKGSEPSTLSTLKTTTGYLPSSFSTNNYFGGNISFSTNVHKLKSFTTTDNNLKSNIYDYYYSNKYRINTKAPLSTNNSDIEIILSAKEKFIYTNKTDITTVKATAVSATAGKYYLDTNGVLHWYEGGVYKFSVDKDLIVDSSVTMINADKTVNTAFKDMIRDVTYAGQTILQNNSNTNTADAYIGINENTIVRQNPDVVLDTQLGLIQIGKNSGGMIINGDIYTWGNNENRITSIDIDEYTKNSGSTGSKTPVVNTLVRVRAKIYDNDLTDSKDLTTFYTQNYFSSPLRPRFVDLFSNTKNGTCGITTNGELYCGGIVSASDKSFGNLFTQVDTTRNGEMLYRSTYFDGTTDSKKATKIFANNQLWLILSKDGDIYRWGYEDTNNNGFSGNGTPTFNVSSSTSCVDVCTNYDWQWYNWSWHQVCTKYRQECTTTSTINTDKVPEKITENITTIKFKDISNTLSSGYRKMFALSTDRELYIWGMDTDIANMPTCSVSWEGASFNLCQPTKITTSNSNLPTDLTFESIQSGRHAIIALGSDNKYYKIEQPVNKKVQITYLIDKTDVLSIDLTSTGIVVYVNSTNQLISDYFSTFDTTFNNTINSMLWKSIKVLEDTNNSMCGINTDNQMYCWGVQTYSSTTNSEDNTFMLPVFNTNLFDINRDYLVSEGGANTTPTTMTSGTWLNNSKFYIKYPTYIGGFNYEFIFK